MRGHQFLRGINRINRGYRGELSGLVDHDFFLLRPFDLEPQAIPEALRAALRDLALTFGTSKTLPELEKIEN